MPVQIDNREVRSEARELLRSASVSPYRFTAFYLAVNLVLDLIGTAAAILLGRPVEIAYLTVNISFVGVLASLLTTVLLAGYVFYILGAQEGRPMGFESLFYNLPYSGGVILLTMLQGFLIALGLSFFIVPGGVLALAWSFSIYQFCETPQLGAIGALRRSRRLTSGYRLQLLALVLSFLPLLLLFAVPIALIQFFLDPLFPDTLAGALLSTLCDDLLTGCAAIYITPSMAFAQAVFYRRVCAAKCASADAVDDFGDSEE